MLFKEFSALPSLSFLFLTWTYSLLARVLWKWNYIFKSTEFSDTILCAGHKAISPGTMIEGFNAPPISVQSILCFPSACFPFPSCFIVIYFCSLRSICWRILMGEWVLWKRYILVDFFLFHDSSKKNHQKQKLQSHSWKKTQAFGITVQSINHQRGCLMFDFIICNRSAFTSSDVDAMAAIPKLFPPHPKLLLINYKHICSH